MTTLCENCDNNPGHYLNIIGHETKRSKNKLKLVVQTGFFTIFLPLVLLRHHLPTW